MVGCLGLALQLLNVGFRQFLGGAFGFLTEGGPGENPMVQASFDQVVPADAAWPINANCAPGIFTVGRPAQLHRTQLNLTRTLPLTPRGRPLRVAAGRVSQSGPLHGAAAGAVRQLQLGPRVPGQSANGCVRVAPRPLRGVRAEQVSLLHRAAARVAEFTRAVVLPTSIRRIPGPGCRALDAQQCVSVHDLAPV
jgi:hypothetical protein